MADPNHIHELPAQPDDATGLSPPPGEHNVTETLGGAYGGAETAPPERVGRYELRGELARGGMGVVYRAHDPAFDREVAVKVLSERLGSRGEAVQRFLDEARVTGQLQHPGIPPVHEVGELPDGRPFLAMKLIKGQTLDELLSARPHPAADRGRFVAVFEQLCQAVAYAHSHDVIHRDLKPANVMVGAFGEVQVMDWGLAKVLGSLVLIQEPDPTEPVGTEIRTLRDTDGSLTQAGSILGTPAFMPPEQAGGEVERVDRRADVFGLGAVLCVILTGTPPYTGRDRDAVRLKSIRGDLADAYELLQECAAEPGLIALCKQCLSADPEARPQDADEVARAVAGLRAAAEERAKSAELRRAKAEVQTAEQRKRRKVQAALGLSFTALVVLGGAFAWWTKEQQRTKETEARIRRDAVEREVNQSLENAVARYGRARGADRDEALWGEARAAAMQADAQAAAADASPEVRERIRTLLAEIERTGKNRRLVATLLNIQASMGDDLTENTDQDFPAADARYFAAFQEYGTDILHMPPAEAAAMLRNLGGEVRGELAAALDDWAYVRHYSTRRMESVAEIYAVTRLLDPDPLRNRIRDTILAKNSQALTKLADEIDPAKQPVQTVNLVAVFLSWFLSNETDQNAAKFLQRAQPHHPSDFQINHNLAYFFNRSRNYSQALPYCMAAIAIRPQSAAAWQDAARAYSGLGRDSEAVGAFRRVCELAPRLWDHRITVGGILERQGKTREAVEEYRKAIGGAVGRAGAFIQPAVVTAWAKHGLLKEAETACRVAMRQSPNELSPRYLLCELLTRQQRTAELIHELAALTNLSPTTPTPLLKLANLHRDAGEFEKARDAFRKAAALIPPSTEAFAGLAGCLLELGDHKGAAEALHSVFQLEPGTVLQRPGHFTVALLKQPRTVMMTVYRSLVEAAPKSPARLPLLRLIAYEHCKDGRFGDAGWAFDFAVEIEPTDSLLAMHWSLARFLAGDREGHRKSARTMMERFRTSTNGSDLERTAKAALLATDMTEHGEFVKLADRAIPLEPQGYLSHYLMARGLAALREGQWEAAIEFSTRSRTEGGPQFGNVYKATNRAIEAIALAELGRGTKADLAMRDAELLSWGHRTTSTNWPDLEIARLLVREARTRLDRIAPPPRLVQR